MEVRLLDEGLNDIKKALRKLAKQIEEQKKVAPKDVKLFVIFRRGDIEMKNGEWMKNPKLYERLNLSDIDQAFSENNLNMGLLGYGDPKGGLKELMTWVKQNVNPKKLQGEHRDLKMSIVKPIKVGKNSNTGDPAVQITIEVPAKGIENSKDLTNAKLDRLGYLGIKEWQNQVLNSLRGQEQIDKVLKAVLTGKADLKTEVGEIK